MVTVDDVRRVALGLPRTTEHLIRDRVKFRVRQLVYVAFSRDETLMAAADMRYHWVDARTAALDVAEMTELVTDAWTMVVPQYVAREYFDEIALRRGQGPP